MQTELLPDRAPVNPESQLVTFLLNGEEFGFDIMSVREIIRPPKVSKVPRMPGYVEGVANLRGVLLPIIDMRTRFGLERKAETDGTRVLVVDSDGVKTGLRVDRVQQVTRVLLSDVKPPPSALHGTSAGYLDGVVQLENGRRIIMALNAGQICRMESLNPKPACTNPSSASTPIAATPVSADGVPGSIVQMVSFRIANEEYAFEMEHVREVLRVSSPNPLPDAPPHILGVLTVRGQILLIVDLRRLLHQPSLAEEFTGACRHVREQYERWNARGPSVSIDLSAPHSLKAWVGSLNISSRTLLDTLSSVRNLNETALQQVLQHAPAAAVAATVSAVTAALQRFEKSVAANIHEDQRIIVVEAGGSTLGLVVDHVNEVLNIPRTMLAPTPVTVSTEGRLLESVAKLDGGRRLIFLLNIQNLMAQNTVQDVPREAAYPTNSRESRLGEAGPEWNELQLVTFLLAGEEYGVPISQIQRIDRLCKITTVPRTAPFVEGVTNLRGEIVPILNTRRRFNLEPKTPDDRTRIIIVELGGVKTGLIVDSVREVLSLSRKDMAPLPESIRVEIDQHYVSGIAKADSGKRMIVLLDVEKILNNTGPVQQ